MKSLFLLTITLISVLSMTHLQGEEDYSRYGQGIAGN